MLITLNQVYNLSYLAVIFPIHPLHKTRYSPSFVRK